MRDLSKEGPKEEKSKKIKENNRKERKINEHKKKRNMQLGMEIIWILAGYFFFNIFFIYLYL